MSNAKQFGFKCGMTGKRRFKTQHHAENRAQILLQELGSAKPMRAYHCDFCGGYHLTKK